MTGAAPLHNDRSIRRRDYARASQILIDEVPEVFLYAPKFIQLTRGEVRLDAQSQFAPYRIRVR